MRAFTFLRKVARQASALVRRTARLAPLAPLAGVWAGIALIAFGAALIFPPAAFIVGGVGIIAIAIDASR